MPRLPPPDLPDWLARMLPEGILRYCLEVDGERMHVMELGRGRPVLMLHGNPTWGFLYRKVAAALAGEEFRVILPDLIGLGFSSKPRRFDAHTLENHARWVGALLDELALEELIFVGQDWGGPIGVLALAEGRERRERPDLSELLKGMVIMNTVLGPPRPGFRATAFHRFSRRPLVSDIAFRLLGFPQRALHRVQGDPASIRGDVRRAYLYPLKGLANNLAPLALARMVPNSLEHPSVEPLRRVQAFAEGFGGPAAIVWGDRDPVLGRAFRRVAEVLPRAEATRTQAGHFIQEEEPALIADAIRKVAAGIEG